MRTVTCRIFVATALVLIFQCCKKQHTHHLPLNQGVYPDTLRVGTLYGPTSYFQYRDQTMGYDFSLVEEFARDKDLIVEYIMGSTVSNLIEMIDSGEIDLVAYDVPVTAETLESIIPCGYEHITQQVLVQPSKNKLINIIELIDKDIYVEKDSKYYHRLENLNEELGGGINIHIVDEDSLISEDLIEMVSAGEIPYTIVDSDVARLNKAYFKDLDFSMEISFPQRSSWAVSKDSEWLADSITEWYIQRDVDKVDRARLKWYFELSKAGKFEIKDFSRNFSKGYISNFDSYFKKNSEKINWDWRLLAAMGYAESKFHNDVVSWAGAKGIMQVMPATARAFGYTDQDVINPEKNIELASKIINSLYKSLSQFVPDSIERRKFSIAAYNSGLAHVIDAIYIARAYGYNPEIWDGNVSEALKMKSQPEIYNNREICRYGYFKGTYTTAYVRNVMTLYDKAVSSLPNN